MSGRAYEPPVPVLLDRVRSVGALLEHYLASSEIDKNLVSDAVDAINMLLDHANAEVSRLDDAHVQKVRRG